MALRKPCQKRRKATKSNGDAVDFEALEREMHADLARDLGLPPKRYKSLPPAVRAELYWIRDEEMLVEAQAEAIAAAYLSGGDIKAMTRAIRKCRKCETAYKYRRQELLPDPEDPVGPDKDNWETSGENQK